LQKAFFNTVSLLAVVALIFYVWSGYLDLSISTPPADLDDYWAVVPEVRIKTNYRYVKVPTNGIKLNVLEAGSSGGDLVLLLHGFPETAFISWYQHIGPFVSAGYHVIAPDMRGYNTSDQPEPISPYRADELVKDIVGLLDYFKAQKAYVIGHDWGGVVAWELAMAHPERVEKMVVVNSPHPDAFFYKLLSSFSQLRKSWYMFFFQITPLAKVKMARYNFSELTTLTAQAGLKGKTFPQQLVPMFHQAWSEKETLGSMMAYYRAAFFYKTWNRKSSRVTVPTLILWGRHDIALEEELVNDSQQYCDNVDILFLENSSHFPQHDEPERFFEAASHFISKKED
jgi:pimeloyl-ACP methyl ester carboxylesterase